MQAFWSWAASKDWGAHAAQLEHWSDLLPIMIFYDGVEFHRDSEFLVWTWSSMCGGGSLPLQKFLVAVAPAPFLLVGGCDALPRTDAACFRPSFEGAQSPDVAFRARLAQASRSISGASAALRRRRSPKSQPWSACRRRLRAWSRGPSRLGYNAPRRQRRLGGTHGNCGYNFKQRTAQ